MPATHHKIKVPAGVSVHAIEKPPCDDRDYIGLIAKNGMRILLISDPTAEKSAASLNVGVGTLQEDRKYGGVAHLLEHIVHQGSEKYTNHKMFEEFVTDHGGSYNAYTNLQCTVYYFDIFPKYFFQALDIFGHMFIKPTFTEFAFDAEINAVNQEYEGHLGSDAFRIYHIQLTSYNKNHPLNHFDIGNLNTLKKLPREANITTKSLVVDFYDRWYSSNVMNLAVSSKESLQELADVILPLINKIPNKNIEIEPVPPDPFENAGRGKLYKIATLEEQYNLSIKWVYPNMMEEYRSMPDYVLKRLVESDRKGCLAEYLQQQRGWAEDISLSLDDDVPGCGLASLDLTLSSDGFDNWEEVVKITFQYLNIVRGGMHIGRFLEAQKILEVDFDHTEKIDEMEYTLSLAEKMQKAKLEDVLTHRNLLYDINLPLTLEIIDSLKPSLCCIYLMSQKFKDIAKIKEPYYEGMYAVEPIPDTLIEEWENCGKSSFLSLPPPNKFIPDKLEILKEPIITSEYPVVIMETPLGRLWHKQDTVYKRPFANIDFFLMSPDICRDIETFIFYNIYENLVGMTLDKILYDASLCGYISNFMIDLDYIKVSIDGYSDKLDTLCQEVSDRIFYLESTKTEFDLVKENLVRDFRNFPKQDQDLLAAVEFEYIMQHSLFLPEEKLQAAEAMTYERFMEMQKDQMKTLTIEAQVYGNVDENKAKECMDIMHRGITKFWPNVVPLPESKRHFIRSTYIPAGKTYIRTLRSPVHPANMVMVYYQIVPNSLKDNVYVHLFADMFKDYVFDTLRTKEHLGYLASILSYRERQSNILVIEVMSNKDHEFVQSRILAVMRSAGEELNSMSEEKFSEHVESLINNLLEKPKSIRFQSIAWIVEFTEEQIMFDRPNLMAEILRNITKQDFIEFYERHLAPDAPEIRRVTIVVRPEDFVPPLASEQTDDDDDDDNAQVITDIEPDIRAEMEKDEEILDIKEWVKSMPVVPRGYLLTEEAK